MVPKNRKASPMIRKSLTLSHAAGRSVFTGKLADDKTSLRAEVAMLTAAYSRDNGVIHVCRPGVAVGASFTQNKHPRNSIVGAQSPLTV